MASTKAMLSGAESGLLKAKENLIDAERQLKSKSPQNSFLRPGFPQYTSFASNAVVRPQRPLLGTSSLGFNVASLPFSEFVGRQAKGFNSTTNIFDDVVLWNGIRGDYLTASESILQEALSMISQPSPLVVVVDRNLRLTPEEFLLVNLSQKLRGDSDKSLIFAREHYRYPDDKASLQHFITTFPLKLLLTPRDFLCLTTFKRDADGTILYGAQSINGLLPESKGCVRGVIKLFGFQCTPIASGCRLRLVLELDPAVWMPRVSLKETLTEMMMEFIAQSETVGINLRRHPKRVGLFKSFLPFADPHRKVTLQTPSPEDELSLDELRKVEEEIDEELALLDEESDVDNDAYSDASELSLKRNKRKVNFEDEMDDESIDSDDLISLASTSSSYSDISLD